MTKLVNVVYRHDLLDEYVSFVTKTTDIELEGMKIVLDCANGAAYEAMPKFYVVSADVIVIHDKPKRYQYQRQLRFNTLESLMESCKRT